MEGYPHAAKRLHLRGQDRQRLRPPSAQVLPGEAVRPRLLRRGLLPRHRGQRGRRDQQHQDAGGDPEGPVPSLGRAARGQVDGSVPGDS